MYSTSDTTFFQNILLVAAGSIMDAAIGTNGDAASTGAWIVAAANPIKCYYKRTSSPVATSYSEITYSKTVWWYADWWRTYNNPDYNCYHKCNDGAYVKNYYSGQYKTYVEGKNNWAYCLCADYMFHQ